MHQLLASHQDVYMPTRRTEIHFFDVHWERGTQWYVRFFPSGAEADRYQAMGEITPHYLYCDHCPERIASIPVLLQLELEKCLL